MPIVSTLLELRNRYTPALSDALWLILEILPSLYLKNTEKNDVSLADYSGQTVILAFYPGAFTGVCDKEMCVFQDNLANSTVPTQLPLGLVLTLLGPTLNSPP